MEDIPILANEFLGRLAPELGKKVGLIGHGALRVPLDPGVDSRRCWRTRSTVAMPSTTVGPDGVIRPSAALVTASQKS